MVRETVLYVQECGRKGGGGINKGLLGSRGVVLLCEVIPFTTRFSQHLPFIFLYTSECIILWMLSNFLNFHFILLH